MHLAGMVSWPFATGQALAHAAALVDDKVYRLQMPDESAARSRPALVKAQGGRHFGSRRPARREAPHLLSNALRIWAEDWDRGEPWIL